MIGEIREGRRGILAKDSGRECRSGETREKVEGIRRKDEATRSDE